MNRSLLRHRFAQNFIRKHFIAMDSTSKFQTVHDPDKKEFVIQLKGQFITSYFDQLLAVDTILMGGGGGLHGILTLAVAFISC